MYHRRLPLTDRIDLTRRCFERVNAMKRADAPLFILSAVSKHGEQAKRTAEIREAYNQMCSTFCAETPGAFFVDIDMLLDPADFVDSDHYTRTGYFKIAEFVNSSSSRNMIPTVKRSVASLAN